MVDTTNKMILLFSMETFGSLMDQVDELFMMTQSDPQSLSQLYLDQIKENPYSRWFAYDVVRNHLKHYGQYMKSNILFMDNHAGDRWAFYPAVMAMIDQLITDERIRIVSFAKYKDDSIWINSESIGIVAEYDHEIDYLNSMGDGDSKLEYLDLRVGKSSNIEESSRVRLRLTNQLYPLLTHIHLQLECAMDAVAIISGPRIKYLSIDNGPLRIFSCKIDLLLFVNDNVQLDYLNVRWYSSVIIAIRYRGEDYRPIEGLVNRQIRYVDIQSPDSTLSNIVHHIFDGLSEQDMEPLDPREWPRLTHLGFRRLGLGMRHKFVQYDTKRCNILATMKNYINFLPHLTSLDVPLMNSHVSIVNKLSDQLVSLGLNYILKGVNNITLPTQLKHIRTLHIFIPMSSRASQINIKIGRWNLPKTCSLVSMYFMLSIKEFNNNFDLTKFKHLKYLMSGYFDNLEDSWISGALTMDTTTCIVNYPASRSKILSPPDYMVTWSMTKEITNISNEDMVNLFKEVEPRNNYNTNVYLKRLILEQCSDTLRE